MVGRTSRVTKTPTRFQDDDGKLLSIEVRERNANELISLKQARELLVKSRIDWLGFFCMDLKEENRDFFL